MALQASGAISISELATEFGDTVPNSLSEFYNGGSLVPSVAYETITASNLTGSYNPNARYPGNGGYDPQINTSGRVYWHALWGDNGSTISMDMSFNVDKTGTYSYYFGWFIQNTNAYGNVTIQVNGSQVAYHNLYTTNNNTTSATGTFSVTAGNTIRVFGTAPSAGWSAHTIYIGGDTSGSNQLPVAGNSSVPTSGVLSLSNFYGASS